MPSDILFYNTISCITTFYGIRKVAEADASLFMPSDAIKINKLDVQLNNFNKPKEDDIMTTPTVRIGKLQELNRTQNVSKLINIK